MEIMMLNESSGTRRIKYLHSKIFHISWYYEKLSWSKNWRSSAPWTVSLLVRSTFSFLVYLCRVNNWYCITVIIYSTELGAAPLLFRTHIGMNPVF